MPKQIPAIYHGALESIGIDHTWPMHRVLASLAFTPSGRPRAILGTSTKIEKGNKIGVLSAVVYLSPSIEAVFNTCPMATDGCARACLGHSAGHLALDSNKRTRIAKTLWFRLFRDHFMAQLDMEITAHASKAERMGKHAAIRLNGSSDIRWERYGVPQRHPHVTFYDYTKHPARARRTRPSNYHLTYSLSEDPRSQTLADEWLAQGGNVAVVVAGPEGTKRKAAQDAARSMLDAGMWRGYPTMDGDETDARFWDEPGHWVVLYAKGGAWSDTTGFVQRIA